MEAFSLQFCDFLYQNEEVLKIFHIKRNGFSLTVKMKTVFNNVLFLVRPDTFRSCEFFCEFFVSSFVSSVCEFF